MEQNILKSEWFGGEYQGSIRQHKGRKYELQISNQQDKVRNYITEYCDSLEKAEYRRKVLCSMYNKVYNRYRHVIGDGDEYIEVQLQNNLIMKCDIEDLPIVQESIWTARISKGKKTYYASRRENKTKNQEHILFHRRICPNYTQVDHINRDGLDNRKFNLREGGNKINANNKSIHKNNKSGNSGVFYEGGDKPRWRCQWSDINGKRQSKSFSVAKWGEEAYEQACAWRHKYHKEKIDKLMELAAKPIETDDVEVEEDDDSPEETDEDYKARFVFVEDDEE